MRWNPLFRSRPVTSGSRGHRERRGRETVGDFCSNRAYGVSARSLQGVHGRMAAECDICRGWCRPKAKEHTCPVVKMTGQKRFMPCLLKHGASPGMTGQKPSKTCIMWPDTGQDTGHDALSPCVLPPKGGDTGHGSYELEEIERRTLPQPGSRIRREEVPPRAADLSAGTWRRWPMSHSVSDCPCTHRSRARAAW